MDIAGMFEGTILVRAVYTTIAALVVYMLISRYRQYKAWEAVYDLIPGRPNKHWLLGNMHEHPGENQDGIEFNLEVMAISPKLARFWAGRWICVVVFHHPDTVRLLLKGSAPKPLGFGSVYALGIRWLGEGLLLSSGDKWFRNRKLLTPSFHFNILQTYIPVFNKCVDELLDKFSGYAKKGGKFETFTDIGLCSLDIISRCAFSYNTDCQTQGDQHPYVLLMYMYFRDQHPYVNAVHRLSTLWVRRSLSPICFSDFIYFYLTRDGWEFKRHCRYVHAVAEGIIQKRRQEIEQNGLPGADDRKSDGEPARKYQDFLDTLLTARDEEGVGMSDLDIRNEADTFLFEGHDTTTSGTTYALFALAKHPEIQEKVRQEVDGILGDRDSDEIQWKDLSQMEYLTMCIKEALRNYCPVHFMSRQTTEDMVVEGHFIPAGSLTAVNIYNHHHNKVVWGEDCLEFKPERFSPENVKNMDPFAFIPFSAGTRNCIGQNFAMMEMKIIIARILHRFRLSTVPDHVYRLRVGVVMRSENGIPLVVTAR